MDDETLDCPDETLSMTLSSLESSKEASQAAVTQIPGYELKRELGRGSFGIVWEAVRAQTGQRVALKLVLHEKRLHWEYFRRELALLVDLEDHPYTLTVLDADLGHSPPFIVTPLVEGGSLQAHEGADLPKIYRWIHQMAEALQYIHSKGVIHCDLKPSNIFVTSTESIRVGDLGQSRRVVDGEVAWGTIGYMAPEQCNQPLGRKSTPSVLWDVYGFGATAYWLLTRKRARIRESDQERLASATGANQLASYYSDCLKKNEMVPIRSLNPKVDEGIAAIVEHCLAIVPARRTQSMEDVLQDLDRLSSGHRLMCLKPWSARYLFFWALGRRSFQFALVALLLLLVGGLYAVVTYQQRQYTLLTQSGLHAIESGRIEEAYLRWLGALRYEPGDAATRARLSFLPVLMTYPDLGEVNAVAFNPDGTRLATAAKASSSSPNASARIWDTQSGEQIAEIKHRDSVPWVAFSPTNPDLVATASWDRSGVVYDIKAQRILFQIDHRGSGPAPALSQVLFSNDGKLLASTAQDGSLRLWDVRAQRRLPLYSAPDGPDGQFLLVQPICFNADGTRLAALSNAQTVRLWDTQTGRALSIILKHSEDINDLQFHPTLPLLATGADNGNITVWDTRTGRSVRSLKKLSTRVNALRFSPTGKYLAAAGDDGTVRVWDLATPAWESFDYYHQRPARNLNFNHDGNLLAVGMGEKERLWSLVEANGAARVWNVLTHMAVTDVLPHDGPVNQVLFHPRLNQLVAACGNSLRVSSLYPGTAHRWLVLQSGHGALPTLPICSKYLGKILPSSGLEVTDPQGHKICTVEHGDQIRLNAFAFSQDGTMLATGSDDRTARLWQLPQGTPISRPLPHEGQVSAVAFNQDGQWLATSSTSWCGTTVRIWDVLDGTPISPPLYCEKTVTRLDFSSDGLALVANQGSYVWPVQTTESDADLRQSITHRLKADLNPAGLLVPVP